MVGKTLVSALCFASAIFATASNARPSSGKSKFSWEDTKYLYVLTPSSSTISLHFPCVSETEQIDGPRWEKAAGDHEPRNGSGPAMALGQVENRC